MNKSYPKECCVRNDPWGPEEVEWRNRSKEARNGNQLFVSQTSVGLSRMD
jgi:hypothetical protein